MIENERIGLRWKQVYRWLKKTTYFPKVDVHGKIEPNQLWNHAPRHMDGRGRCGTNREKPVEHMYVSFWKLNKGMMGGKVAGREREGREMSGCMRGIQMEALPLIRICWTCLCEV